MMLTRLRVLLAVIAVNLPIDSGTAVASSSVECTVQAQIVRGGPALDVPGVVFLYGSHLGLAEVACYPNLPAGPYTTQVDMAIQVIDDGVWTDRATNTCKVDHLGPSATVCTVIWGEDADELPALAPRRLVVDVSAPEDLDPYVIQSIR